MTVYTDLVRYRELFGNLFRRDLQAKYKGSFLGVAWTLANPVLLMAIYLLVFSVLWKAVNDRPLRALPALGARAVDLLLELDPERVALAARQREPDPQDALSAPARAALDRGDEPRLVRR